MGFGWYRNMKGGSLDPRQDEGDYRLQGMADTASKAHGMHRGIRVGLQGNSPPADPSRSGDSAAG